MQLPKKYTSQTLVLVARPTVSEKYVDRISTQDPNQRLASMKQQILSRTRLEPVLEKFDLYHEDRKKVHEEDLIQRMITTIEITPLEPMPGTQDRNLPRFKVGEPFDIPQTAPQMCTDIASIVID